MSNELFTEQILQRFDLLIQSTNPDQVEWLTAFGTIGAVVVALFIPFVTL